VIDICENNEKRFDDIIENLEDIQKDIKEDQQLSCDRIGNIIDNLKNLKQECKEKPKPEFDIDSALNRVEQCIKLVRANKFILDIIKPKKKTK